MPRYYSTHHAAPPVAFEAALMSGLAPDGGLYYPEVIPPLADGAWDTLRAERDAIVPQPLLHAVANAVLAPWLAGEIGRDRLAEIVRGALDFPIPLREVGPVQVMELFHGPTLAFKDVAARFLARMMSHFLAQRGDTATLLVATSGDTGGAVAHGFADQPNLRVVVLFPQGRISQLQREQLTRVADNVLPIEVEGTFDDCQTLVKQAFVSPDLGHLNLTSANSINIGRLLPQIIPFAYAALMLGRDDLEVVVPSGNFGHMTGALFARAMGVPLPHLIAATNANDSVARYYRTGRYEPRETVHTLSNAMDVGQPSNFERIRELFGDCHPAFREELGAFAVDDATTVATIQRVHADYGYLLCPHSAVGWAAAERHADMRRQPLLVATASPVKFAGEIEATTGIPVDDRAEIERLRQRPARWVTLPNRLAALKVLLAEVLPYRLD